MSSRSKKTYRSTKQGKGPRSEYMAPDNGYEMFYYEVIKNDFVQYF